MRDLDGSWNISDPDVPFTPSGVSDLSPRPSSSAFRFPRQIKGEEEQPFTPKDGYKSYEYDVIIGQEHVPPPAYGHDDGSTDRTNV